MPEPQTRITRYEVSCVPERHIDASLFTMVVEYRGAGRWAVTRSAAYHDANGNRSWGYDWENGREPVTDEERAACKAGRQKWLDRHRFDEQAALELARRLAPEIAYPGYTVADALAKEETR